MTRAEELRLEYQARAYKKEGFSLEQWIDDLGWEEWMLEYCEDAQADEDPLSEGDVKAINEAIKDIWENVTVEAVYDEWDGEILEINEKPITECNDQVKEAIEEYFFTGQEYDVSEFLRELNKACDIEDICDVLNLHEFGYSSEKRYITKEL